MKRPLALIGLTSMLVLTVCFYADFTFTLWLCGLSLAGLLITLMVKKLRRKITLTAIFAAVLISATAFVLFSQLYVMPLQTKYQEAEAQITATLIEEPENDNNGYYYTLRTNTINGEDIEVKLRLYTKTDLLCNVGDSFTLAAELKSSNFGKYLADKVYLRASVYSGIEVTKAESRPFYYYIVKLRQSIRTTLYSELEPDTAAFASAILLGDNSGFSDETYIALRRSGLTHIMVVSGLHLAILTMLYTRIFGGFIKNKYINVACMVLIVLFFLCLTGFGKSSIRAAIMLFVLISARLFNRVGDSLNSLGFAAILLCSFNPYVAGDVGVLLSFSATFGIVVFSMPLENSLTRRLAPVEESRHKYLNKTLRFVAALLSTTFTAALCTLPVNVLFFGKVSLVQIFTNLLALPLIQWFMLFSALCAVFCYVSVPFAADFLALFAELFGKLILCIAKFFASFDFAYVKADYVFVIFWIVSSVLLFALAYILRRNGKGLHMLCLVMSVLILMSGTLGHIITTQNTITLYITNCPKGQSVILNSRDGNVLIFSANDNYSIESTKEVLDTVYSENQLMIISDERNEDIASLFDYREILMYDKINGSNYTVKLWDKATLNIFGTDTLYMYLAFSGTSVLILPSDGNVADIPESMQSPDVLITSGMINGMERLSFKTLISNGDFFTRNAVIDFYSQRIGTKLEVTDTIIFDIVG